MKHIPDHQCRRCGSIHDELFQLVDPQGRWAVVTAHCHCGHCWSIIHAAPVNLRALRRWVSYGCNGDYVHTTEGHGPWQAHRLEGVAPDLLSSAS